MPCLLFKLFKSLDQADHLIFGKFSIIFRQLLRYLDDQPKIGPFQQLKFRQLKMDNTGIGMITVQWGSENQTCSVFKWSTLIWILNGPKTKWLPKH